MKIYKKRLVVLLLALFAAFSQKTVLAEPHQTIRNNGDPRTSVDIAFLGDGYTAAEMGKYRDDVERTIQGLFNEEPLKEYQRYFNVHRIDVISNQSGADHPAALGDGSCGYVYDFGNRFPKGGICRNTALDATYGTGLDTRVLTTNFSKVNFIAQSSLMDTQYDLILVIVNDPEYGGTGGTHATFSTNFYSLELALHELGHTFARLADEYTPFDIGVTPPGAYSCEPVDKENIVHSFTVFNYPFAIKWIVWIPPGTTIPDNSVFPLLGVPGVYQGARYCFNLYRPTYNSKMRSLGRPYEQINTEQIIRYIYNYVSLPNASQPAAFNITVQQGQTQKFGVSVPIPLTHSLSITWYVDNQQYATGQFFTLNTNNFALGSNHKVQVKVVDPTPQVRRYDLLQQRDWSVGITNPPVQPNPIENPDQQFFVQQHYQDFLNRTADPGGLAYWTASITSCGSNAVCTRSKRADVSGAFFVEQEFQQTGGFLYRLYRASYGRRPLFAEFLPDRAPLADTVDLEASKTAFANNWVARDTFKQTYPEELSPEDFVNRLYDTAGLAGYYAERQQAIADIYNGKSRAQVLRDLVEIAAFKQREYNASFVLMQYFGYLRRDPDEGGYQFWLDNLNTYNDIHGTIDAFITSAEYRARFGNVL